MLPNRYYISAYTDQLEEKIAKGNVTYSVSLYNGLLKLERMRKNSYVRIYAYCAIASP